jgi:hypothetical protein
MVFLWILLGLFVLGRVAQCTSRRIAANDRRRAEEDRNDPGLDGFSKMPETMTYVDRHRSSPKSRD